MNKNYSESNIKTLNWKEHIRLRPGMYIGKLGDGQSQDDGIYVLFKEIIDNAIDEFVMNAGNQIKIELKENKISIRDFGRGIPLGKIVECISQINTGGKYDNRAFQKSVGLNGVGMKATNALSSYFFVQTFRDGQTKSVEFKHGEIQIENDIQNTTEKDGTLVKFIPDSIIFKDFQWVETFLLEQIRFYTFLNLGLKIYFNGQIFLEKEGLKSLLKSQHSKSLYPIIHFRENDFEYAIIHHPTLQDESYFSFVNGQNTIHGGTHLSAFKEAILKGCSEFYQKKIDSQDIRTALVGCISIRIQEPLFDSQTKTKLGSTKKTPNEDGQSLRSWIIYTIKNHLVDHLHKNKQTAQILWDKIKSNEKDRKEISGVKKLAKERAKTANIHNKKLRDCLQHFNTKHKLAEETTIFITEGDSASGSITKSRNVNTQAIFTLKGKPLNCFGLKKSIVYENEEFNLLQHALNIEGGLEELKYNKIVIATDADVDGSHIRLLLLTFFLQFFPSLIEKRHVYILQTPLFRVRNKKETLYCYDEREKGKALKKLGQKSEITRFKGLGEISPNEFGQFIGENIRLEEVLLENRNSILNILSYYMGKNTLNRKQFLIDNLRTKDDVPEEITKLKHVSDITDKSTEEISKIQKKIREVPKKIKTQLQLL